MEKGVVFPLKVTLLALVLFAAAAAVFGQQAVRGGTIVRLYLIEPKTFDPLVTDDASSYFSNLLYDGLVSPNEHLEHVPDLAESWEVSPNGLEWKFHIRKNVLFHDGTELGADDAVATYTALLDPSSGSPLQEVYRVIKGFRAEDRYTFVVSLKEPYGPLLDLMLASIVPARFVRNRQLMEKEYVDRPVGTGPFRIAKRAPGEIVFSAFDGYFKGRPYLDSVVFKLDASQKKAWVSLVQGTVDVATDLDYEDYAVTKKDSRFKSYESLDTFNYMLLFNTKDPLFSQKAIRQAISSAVDRQDIIDKAFPGAGVASTGPFQPNTWPYNPDPSIQKYDPQRARKILADLGWKDTDGDWILEKGKEKLSFTILIDKGDAMKELAVKRIQWQLLQVGAQAVVKILDLEDLMQNRLFPGDFQAVLIQQNTWGDPDIVASAFWHSASIGKLNFSAYKNPEVDRLIEEGRRTSDHSQRTKIYQKIHNLVADDAPAVFLFYKSKFAASSGSVGGIDPAFNIFNTIGMNKWFIAHKQ